MGKLVETPDWKTRIDVRDARGHLQYVKEQAMKAGAKLLEVLKEVHDRKSWRFDYESWEDYCQKAWNFSRVRAHQIMAGADFLGLMNEAGGGDVTGELNEGHLRELRHLEPVKAVKALRKLKKNGGRLTAARISHELHPDVLPPDKPCCPTCGSVLKKSRNKPARKLP